jgi:hypothetical protein
MGSPNLSRDESLAVSLIAAQQHGARSAALICASKLLGQPNTHHVIRMAECFAKSLEEHGATLPSECPVPEGRAA